VIYSSTPRRESRRIDEREDMQQYMVERHLPDFPPDQLPAAAGAAKEKSAELSSEGQEVRYVRSTYVGDGEKCYCLFEAESPGAVEEVQRRAGLPYEKIHEAAFLTADQV
jgi:hypothetical protein